MKISRRPIKIKVQNKSSLIPTHSKQRPSQGRAKLFALQVFSRNINLGQIFQRMSIVDVKNDYDNIR